MGMQWGLTGKAIRSTGDTQKYLLQLCLQRTPYACIQFANEEKEKKRREGEEMRKRVFFPQLQKNTQKEEQIFFVSKIQHQKDINR